MRREKTFEIIDDGNTYKFHIMQMSAIKQERWLINLALLASKGNAIEGLAPQGLNDVSLSNIDSKKIFTALGKITFDDVQPLMDELLECCKYVNGNTLDTCTPKLLDDIFTNFKSVLTLRWEVIKLSFDFFQQDNNQPEALLRIAKKQKNMPT